MYLHYIEIVEKTRSLKKGKQKEGDIPLLFYTPFVPFS
ncbi:hypothetical protein KIS4809_1614 [Bacillus sp. ZZV12-4809]|nr:hypothetical protein KIS4809_1614 [Bacillus sp. ZZV12-4809]